MSRDFDGIICFGGIDWWYHNRGHYDPQMMQNLKRRVPVLYVNSIGMRAPKIAEGAMFFTRVKRKLKSLTRGFTRVDDRLGVFSVVSLPGGGTGWKGRLNAKVLALQTRLAARRMGIRKPLIWVACPPAACTLPYFAGRPVVYQRTDRFEDFEGVNGDQIKGFDEQLKDRADLVLYCSTKLFNEEAAECRQAMFVDHGVDYERFSTAGMSDPGSDDPEDLADMGRPRVGFIGGIDSHTFDPDLYATTVAAMPECQFLLVGACSLPEGWLEASNVRFVGRKPYGEVARYMAACDVLIMPWNRSRWIEACNPVKLKEYLAVGRPVVTTYFPEIERYRDHVSIARDVEAFVSAIRNGLNSPGCAAQKRARVANETWSAKAEEVWRAVA